MDTYALRPINDLLGRTNIAGSNELLTFSEVKLQEVYQFLANGQNSDNIILDDVQTVDKSESTVIFHKEKRISMSNI